MAIRLRPATANDAPQIAAIYAPWVHDTAISFETEAPDTDEMARRIAKTQAHWAWLVAEHDGQVLAYAYAGSHAERAAYRWSTSVSVYGAPAAHRRGLGRALYTALLGLLRLQGFHSAYAGITQPNAASVGLHLAMGFQLIGTYPDAGHKLGRWNDVSRYWLQLQARGQGPVCAAPPETRTLATVLATPEGVAALAAGQALLHG